MNWLHHYAVSKEEKPRTKQLVLRLFRDKKAFATWIRLHDMDLPWVSNAYYDRTISHVASPLYYAALLGLETIMNSIFAIDTWDADLSGTVNAQGGYYGNALHAASFGGHEKAVQILLDQGADVNAQGGYYGNALQAASFGGHEKVVQMLLDQGADVNTQGGCYSNALQAVSLSGHEKVVQILLDQGADVNAQGGEYGNAL